MKLIVALCVFFALAEAVKLPPNFKTCNRKQPNFKTCFLEAARYGVTQLGRPYKQLKMASLEPLIIPQIEASVETPLVNVSSVLTNCKFHGLTETQIDDIEIDFDKKNIHLEAVFPDLRSECSYKIDGRIIVAPVKGSGSSSAAFKNFKWTFDLTYEEVKKGGKTYVKPISSKFDGKPESLTMNMDELFGGDRELGERANRVINDNWSELYDEVKVYYLDNAKDTWMQIMNGWFSKVSLEEAFDN